MLPTDHPNHCRCWPLAGCRPGAAVPALARPQSRRQLHVVAAKKGGKKGGGQKKGPGSLMDPPKPAEPWLQARAGCPLRAAPVAPANAWEGLLPQGRNAGSRAGMARHAPSTVHAC